MAIPKRDFLNKNPLTDWPDGSTLKYDANSDIFIPSALNNIVDWTVDTHLNYWTTVTQPHLLAKQALGTLPQSVYSYDGYGADAPVAYAYVGGVLAPNGRVWLVPYGQATSAKWHYIDTATGTVVAYAHGLGADTPVANAYYGGVLAPNGRVYLVPLEQSAQTKWHYIDTSTGSVVAYAHGLGAEILLLLMLMLEGC
jgi:hypothetical protein